MIVSVSKDQADCRTIRQMAGLVSQFVVCWPDVRLARKAIHRYRPEIVVYETQVWEGGKLAGADEGLLSGALRDAGSIPASR